jgi:hypothetical protein
MSFSSDVIKIYKGIKYKNIQENVQQHKDIIDGVVAVCIVCVALIT